MKKVKLPKWLYTIFGVIGRFFKWLFAKRCPNCLSKNTKVEVYNMTDNETGRQCNACGNFWYS